LFEIELQEENLPTQEPKKKGGKNKAHNKCSSTDEMIKNNISSKYQLECKKIKNSMKEIKDHFKTNTCEWLITQFQNLLGPLPRSIYDQNKIIFFY